MKGDKGITLVALIITIIVLLILAVVTISAVNEGSLFSHANNAAEAYSKSAEEENSLISNYISKISSEKVNIEKNEYDFYSNVPYKTSFEETKYDETFEVRYTFIINDDNSVDMKIWRDWSYEEGEAIPYSYDIFGRYKKTEDNTQEFSIDSLEYDTIYQAISPTGDIAKIYFNDDGNFNSEYTIAKEKVSIDGANRKIILCGSVEAVWSEDGTTISVAGKTFTVDM